MLTITLPAAVLAELTDPQMLAEVARFIGIDAAANGVSTTEQYAATADWCRSYPLDWMDRATTDWVGDDLDRIAMATTTHLAAIWAAL